MAWQYRTILFEFTKDGLLGDKYVDDEEVEKTLNEMGAQGWELVNVVLLQDGLLAFLKVAVANEVERECEEAGIDAVEPGIDQTRPVAPAVRPEPRILEHETVRAEEIQAEEREHILALERQRREAMNRRERDFFDDIRIS